MQVDITGLYAGFLTLLMIFLMLRVPQRRRQAKIGFGSGGDKELTTRVRAFGNFVEYVPMALVLMVLLESSGIAAWILHALGIVLVVARIIHALGLSATHLTGWHMKGRVYGTVLTASVLSVEAILLIAAQLY